MKNPGPTRSGEVPLLHFACLAVIFTLRLTLAIFRFIFRFRLTIRYISAIARIIFLTAAVATTATTTTATAARGTAIISHRGRSTGIFILVILEQSGLVIVVVILILLGSRFRVGRSTAAHGTGLTPGKVVHVPKGVGRQNEVKHGKAHDEVNGEPPQVLPSRSEYEHHDLHAHDDAVQDEQHGRHGQVLEEDEEEQVHGVNVRGR
mmetsp:Transcript_17521/g.26583  ORF Transcript_17521/g.26583 Transcript_17521/m.26583 type:complete len:206 (-) Transcript_17521:197-814(-)